MNNLTPNPSRPRLVRINPDNNARGFVKQCAVCASAYAPYGFKVDFSKKRGGYWYCKEHIPS